ncbi:MAG: glycosyltransferase family 1 protein [Proteobacteria bacterium]|nr:MAG: glycosyltransferase family 1 protein [Pseudomonadota bacterium]
MEAFCDKSDLLVLSHLRWDFVYQRPQHLMSRFAKQRRVFFIEEPIFGVVDFPSLHIKESVEGVQVVVPHLPHYTTSYDQELAMTRLVNELIEDENIQQYSLWYYTPMALPFTRHLTPCSVMYDCMDELANFQNPPPQLIQHERELLRTASLVFTGGHSLYEAKQDMHHNIHPCPSSIDFKHFAQARTVQSEPADQASIPHPRLGFFGVVDERMDLKLLADMAAARPEWNFVIIGPVVKINPADLPQATNIHYLGKKDYKELPQYLAGWDCALMPFALNPVHCWR